MQKKEYSIGNLTAKQQAEFSQLVRLNMKRAYFSALGFLGNHDDAMEASQEAFLRALRHFGNFDQSKKFFTWYYKILRNLCLNRLRDQKRKQEYELLEISEHMNSNESVSDELESNELKKSVEDALMKLDSDDREILVLKEFENHSYKEIAQLLDVPIGTVMSKLFYARKKLAKLLEEVEI